MNVEIQSLPVSVMNESKIILPNLHLLVSLFRKLQDWPLINTSIWPPDITNLLTGSIPLCALMDSVLFKGLSALSLEWNSPNLFNSRFIHFAYSFFVWLCWIRCVYLVMSVNTVLSYLCELTVLFLLQHMEGNSLPLLRKLHRFHDDTLTFPCLERVMSWLQSGVMVFA